MRATFTSWTPLSNEALEAAPVGHAAVQLRRAEGLVQYPRGMNTLVCFLFCDDIEVSLTRLCQQELEQPGALGQGPLWFRYLVTDEAESIIGSRYMRFVQRFGSPPILQAAITGVDR